MKFKLEAVLQVKIRFEEACQKALHLAEVRRDGAEKTLLENRAQIERSLQLYRENLVRELNLNLANQYQKYLAWLARQENEAVQFLQKCQTEVAEKRLSLIAAAKEKKILEKLKQKAMRDYQAKQAKAENDFLDEIGNSLFIRRRQQK